MNFPPVPNVYGALLSHEHVKEGDFPKTKYTAVFYYPDGNRTFDGRVWAALPHKVEA